MRARDDIYWSVAAPAKPTIPSGRETRLFSKDGSAGPNSMMDVNFEEETSFPQIS